MYENFIHNYSWKNFSKKGIYYDELNRSIIEEFAKNSSLLAHGLLSENKDATMPSLDGFGHCARSISGRSISANGFRGNITDGNIGRFASCDESVSAI